MASGFFVRANRLFARNGHMAQVVNLRYTTA